MTTMTIQVRGRGTLTLPVSLREKYRLGEGDPLTLVDLDGAVLLSPRLLVVPRLAAEMERLRRARRIWANTVAAFRSLQIFVALRR
jgi:bifunctional DNA-binding transcriptional regulator/antitoxin component of YhaV-PrlF toxin-antitoxin module